MKKLPNWSELDWTRLGMVVVEGPEIHIYVDASSEQKKVYIAMPMDGLRELYETLSAVFGPEERLYEEDEIV